MNAPSSVFSLASALVHHAANTAPAVRQRHTLFIANRLALSFAAFACVPFFLAYRGAPSAAEMLAFTFSLAPFAAATVVAQTGRIVLAHAVVVLGLAGLGLTLWLGLGCGVVCAITWLLAAHVEARSAADRLMSWTAGGLTLVLLAILVAVPEAHLAASQSALTSAAAAGLALVYSWIAYAEPRRAEPPRETATDDVATWHAIADTMDDVVLVVDAAGTVERVRMDPQARLGVSARALMGRGFIEHVAIGDRPALLDLFATAARGDAPLTMTVGLRSDNGSSRRIKLRARRVAQSEANTTRVVAILREVEDAKAQDHDVATVPQGVDDATRSKHHFIASMSHELRTPLNAIIGFSEMLASHTLRPADVAKQREYARIINQSGQHLLSVVNAILDMSKINAGTFPIVAEPFDLVPLVDLCCDMVRLKADERGVRIVRDYPHEIEALVGDKRACQQILLNLLSNAVKFTPAGGDVTIGVRLEAAGIAVSIDDTGIGISAADLAKLGDPFFQAGQSLSRSYEGSGLGLSVVCGLVGLHGGTIAIESEPGCGTCVTVRLPQDCRLNAAASGPARIATSARRPLPDFAPRYSEQRMMQVA